jgi:beta-1,2-xylosyltransferase
VEWHADTLIPWYHYVPLKVDYGDIFDIMAYFTGSPDGTLPGRDDLAEEIAANGRQFALQRWR